MSSEALIELVGGAGETLAVSSPGFPSPGHAPLNTSVTVIYHIVARQDEGFIVFITDDWILTDTMCFTVRYDKAVTRDLSRGGSWGRGVLPSLLSLSFIFPLFSFLFSPLSLATKWSIKSREGI